MSLAPLRGGVHVTCSLAGGGPCHLLAYSTFVVNSLKLPLSSAMDFHSWPVVSALSSSYLL